MFNFISNSREHQDLFILTVLDKKKNGSYLEIGAGSHFYGSNTYLLEKKFFWTGVSLDLNEKEIANFKKGRTNPYLCCDATEADYQKILDEYKFSKHIDFLQLDIDPPANTFKAFERIPFNEVSFSVITYEHDVYRGGLKERKASREILENLGYYRVMSDVMHDNVAFEDWYVNEAYMPNDAWKLFIDSDVPMNPGRMPQKYIDIFKSL